MSISFTASGSTSKTRSFLQKMSSASLFTELEPLAQQGVSALSGMTPIESGITATSWGYEIEINSEHAAIYWYNTHENEGVNIAVIIQYGHATGTGGYISGIDYINPAIQPILMEIAENVWRKVTLA